MATHPFLRDLDFALAAGLRVSLQLRNGQEYRFVEIREVDHESFHVVVMTPRTFRDATSRTRLNIGDFTAVEVTDVEI